MPATPYAKLLVSLNAGATQSGGITGANGDTVALTAESTAQWNLDTPPKWEIYSYPDGWTGPASGWTTESVAQPFGGTADIYVYYGLGPPPTFALPALPLWGKFLFRLTVQGGVLNGIISPALTDDTTAVQIESPNGLVDTATLEGTQFSLDRAWSGPLQENLRVIDDALSTVAAIGPYNITPTTVQSSTGSVGVSPLFARGDHSHQLTFSTLNTILDTASAAISVNGQTVTSGGFIAPYFATNTTPRSTTGLLRCSSSTAVVTARDDNDLVDVQLLSWGGAGTDALSIGDNATANVLCAVKTSGDFQWVENGATFGTFSKTNGFKFADGAALALSFTGAAAASGGSALIEAQAGVTTGGNTLIRSGLGGTDSGDIRLECRSNGNISLGSAGPTFGGGKLVLFIANATTVPTTDPTGGGILFVEAGALKFRGSSGTVTTIAPA